MCVVFACPCFKTQVIFDFEKGCKAGMPQKQATLIPMLSDPGRCEEAAMYKGGEKELMCHVVVIGHELSCVHNCCVSPCLLQSRCAGRSCYLGNGFRKTELAVMGVGAHLVGICAQSTNTFETLFFNPAKAMKARTVRTCTSRSGPLWCRAGTSR